MELVDQAFLARLRGDTGRANDLVREAFDKERNAAVLVANDLKLEPTRSVLHRSAASLAMECGEIREAERLIGLALSGNPPDEIAGELRDLLHQVYFHRHLALRGITLEPNEFQFSLSGNSVGFGIAQSKEFIERVKVIETVVYRTAERKLDKPFREGGRRKKRLQQELELYVSVPRAASFAVSFRIGSRQLRLPGMDLAQDVIDEIFECFHLFNSAQTEPLSQRIPDISYYRNFIGLARKIAPDGEEIRSVGFTSLRNGRERRVILSTPRSQAPKAEPAEEQPPPSTQVEVQGILRFADARSERKGLIELIDGQGSHHRVRVPRGMMSDIVRPMFEYEVVVTGRKEKDVIILENIERAAE